MIRFLLWILSPLIARPRAQTRTHMQAHGCGPPGHRGEAAARSDCKDLGRYSALCHGHATSLAKDCIESMRGNHVAPPSCCCFHQHARRELPFLESQAHNCSEQLPESVSFVVEAVETLKKASGATWPGRRGGGSRTRQTSWRRKSTAAESSSCWSESLGAEIRGHASSARRLQGTLYRTTCSV